MVTKSSPIRVHPRWHSASWWLALYARIAKEGEPQQFKSKPAKKGTT